ncbi:MAG: hypothetical protein M1836_002555 [Candelina mexicana]|nr:MAG: hypothetical protein M1836_002555 [Candelina mexicana]
MADVNARGNESEKKSEKKPEKKPRKKNAPDRPMPTWLFPPDEENPVLNPKPKSEEKLRTAKAEREKSISFLKHRAQNAPMRPAPPANLLTLVAIFLTEWGFDGASRLFTAQCQNRNKLDGWDYKPGTKLEAGLPKLDKIYKEWYKEWQERRELDMTSSDEDDDATTKRDKMVKKKAAKLNIAKAPKKADVTSRSGSEDSSSDDSISEDGEDKAKGDKKGVKLTPAKVESAEPQSTKVVGKNAGPAPKTASPSSSSASSSDSDADNEEEPKVAKVPPPKAVSNKLKRKSPTPASSSSSDTSSDSSEDKSPVKPKKSKPSPPALSSESSSDSESSDGLLPKPKTTSHQAAKVTAPTNNARNGSSDSSATLEGAKSKQVSSSSVSSSSEVSSSSSSESEVELPKPVEPKKAAKHSKRKRSASPVPAKDATSTMETSTKKQKSQNTPFSRVPKDVKVDHRLSSNAYQPYDYAEKAHQDLIVTKGKNFTKEKNKKKRGSYRGGAIDVDGRKGIKFDE